MSKYLPKLIFFLLLVSFLVPLIVDAAVTCPGKPCPGGAVCIKNPLCAESFTQLIDALINFIFVLAIAIAPIMFIVAGFYFITAAGEPKKIQTAKDIIFWTLIGLLIVFSAKGIIILFVKIFGVPTP